MPPNPKALTPALRGRSSSAWSQGFALGTEPEGTFGLVEFGIGRLDADRRRQDTVIKRQARIDQTRQARGAFGVADQRLDRAQHALAIVDTRLAEEPAQRLDLNHVAQGGACAMGFDVTHGGG